MPETRPPFSMFLSATEGGDARLAAVEGGSIVARRRRWPMVTAVVAVVGVVAGVSLNLMVTAERVSVDNLSVFRATPGDKGGISEVSNSLGSEYVVDFERNGTFLVYARLQNTGGRDVEIRGIPTHESYYFKIERARVSAERNGVSGGEYRPLRPGPGGAGHPGPAAHLHGDVRALPAHPRQPVRDRYTSAAAAGPRAARGRTTDSTPPWYRPCTWCYASADRRPRFLLHGAGAGGGRRRRRRAPVSLSLAVAAIVLGAIVGVPMGVVAALRRNSAVDYLLSGLSTLGVAVPSYVLVTLLIVVVGVYADLLPTQGWDGLFSRTAVIPVLALAVEPAALIARFTRASTLEVLHQDYVHGPRSSPARAVGASSVRAPQLAGAGRDHRRSGVRQPRRWIVHRRDGHQRAGPRPGRRQGAGGAGLPRDHGNGAAVALVIVVVSTVVDLLYVVVDPRHRTEG